MPWIEMSASTKNAALTILFSIESIFFNELSEVRTTELLLEIKA
jgi:hypothetical protein